jgi:hypothetical protein
MPKFGVGPKLELVLELRDETPPKTL